MFSKHGLKIKDWFGLMLMLAIYLLVNRHQFLEYPTKGTAKK